MIERTLPEVSFCASGLVLYNFMIKNLGLHNFTIPEIMTVGYHGCVMLCFREKLKGIV